MSDWKDFYDGMMSFLGGAFIAYMIYNLIKYGVLLRL